jgi:hypothetical protein
MLKDIPDKLIEGIEKVKDVANNMCRAAENIKKCLPSIEDIDDGLQLIKQNWKSILIIGSIIIISIIIKHIGLKGFEMIKNVWSNRR